MKRALLFVLACCWLLLYAPVAQARIARYAVVAGNNAGWKGEIELRHAEADALKVHDVLVGVGGFSPANVTLLRGGSANSLREALIAMNDRIRQDTAGGDVQALLFVYYSGHGDAFQLHPGVSTLDLGQLERLVRGSAATFRLLVLDACRSGALTRVKGGSLAPPVSIRTEARLAGEGVVFLTATSANEDAQESDALGGSFFTHYLTSALLGAADDDRDGIVTLEEAYRHVSDATIRATSGTFAGIQHPTFQYELRGQGKLPLAMLPTAATSRSTLVFPNGRTYLLLDGGSQGAVVAEVTATDVSRRLSVKPGRYFVRGRGGDFLLEGELQAEAGKVLGVEDRKLRRVEYARLVRKGEGGPDVSHGLLAGYQFRSSFSGQNAPCQGGFVSYVNEQRWFSLTPRLSFCRGGFVNGVLSATTTQLDASLALSHSWDAPWFSVDLGVSLGAGLLRQSFSTRGVAPSQNSFTGYVGAGLGLSRELWYGYYVWAQLESQTYFFRAGRAEVPHEPEIRAAFALRASIGLGLHF